MKKSFVCMIVLAALLCGCALPGSQPPPLAVHTCPPARELAASVLENGGPAAVSAVIRYYPGSVLRAVITNEREEPFLQFDIDERRYALYRLDGGVYAKVDPEPQEENQVFLIEEYGALSVGESASLWVYLHDDLELEEGSYRLEYTACEWLNSKGETVEEVVLTLDFSIE